MKLRPEQLAGTLAKNLQPVYALCSDEPLLLDEAAGLVRQASMQAGYAERQSFQVETGFSWAAWAAGFDSLSLFSEHRLVELRLPTGKPGVEGGKTLEAWCARAPADILLLVMLPRADRTMQAAKWFTALEHTGAVVNLVAPTPEQLPAWIGSRLASKQLKADRETLAFLADRVEGNLLAAHQEIEKLALLLPPGPVDLETARSAVVDVARFDASDLPEALLKGDVARYCRIIDGLQAEGEAPPLALWLLTQELRSLHRLALGLEHGESLPALMRKQRVWESRQPLVSKAVKQLSAARLGRAMLAAAQADRAAKGLLREDAWLLMKQLGLALMGKAGLEVSYGH